MEILTAEFIQSNSDYRKCPAEDKPEYAFIGRSNVGKSSLINMLCGKKGLAKTSATPGKTQLINHFMINGKWYLVDLPGYGYAKTARTEREKWDTMIRNYMMYRKNLMSVFVLIDIRIAPQEKDLDFINWMGEQSIPFAIIFTKADKQTRIKNDFSVKRFTNQLLRTWENIPPYFISSSETKKGKEEVLNYIEESNKLFRNVR
ncbi:MAG: putative GTP-binding protein EngB [Bacteroidetes bacterium ADurb.Bin141]|nr:putative GTP-binding protein EngB [Bacteroidia bacterium]MCB0848745.1 YihA family ribosome biogenesis GTP-binding protein [Bacteroidota bacterium]MCE7956000.1 YihA family ribosome biogenesis GTP-binding protein [Bacteroidetes bacterium CHB6]MCO5289620.1 ribosome biogenesis GTP-binding protein YihA/YsxC [Bacteroidota bacterium]OQB61123.1 MAG: putative GTP-binding protein EngB [Bacteroidetes bacterium ADurb.Bin141]